MQGIFVLRCVGCRMIEKRLAAECVEMPFCKKCNMPMVLEKVIAKYLKTEKEITCE